MATITKIIELDQVRHDYIMIKSGSILEIGYPWDGDDPSTHITLQIKLDHDLCVCIADDKLRGQIIKEAPMVEK